MGRIIQLPEAIHPKLVTLRSTNRIAVVSEMVDYIIRNHNLDQSGRDEIIKSVIDRENLGSTGIGDGLAIPHGKCDKIPAVIGLLAKSDEGVEFNAIDGEPVYLMCMLLSNDNCMAGYLETLSIMAKLFREYGKSGILSQFQ